MDTSTRSRLNAINRAFYAEQASDFAQTRNHAWPGWSRAWQHVTAAGGLRVLDVGCGSGRFARFLTGQDSGSSIEYTGVDASQPLLECAEDASIELSSTRFLCADWVDEAPGACIPAGPFDCIVLLGVLHHVPGQEERRDLVHWCFEQLGSEGVLILTAWRFAAEDIRKRFEPRMVAWDEWNQRNASSVELRELEPGDFLLRWGEGPDLVRYCHYADEAEITNWVEGLPAEVVDRFREDGRGRDLNEYVILRRKAAD